MEQPGSTSAWLWFRVLARWTLLAVTVGSTPIGAHGDLHDQIRAVSGEIAAQPRRADLYLKRGELYRAHHETRPALADYAEALNLNPGLTIAYFCRGRLLFEAGRPSDALPDLDRYLIARPNDAEAHVERAGVRLRLGRTLAAIDDYDAALAQTPSPDWYFDRASALRLLGSAHFERAVDGLDEGLSRLGDIVTLQLQAIAIDVERGHYDAALARIDGELQRAERQDTWLARRGAVLVKAERPAEARAAYNAALREIGRLPAARRNTTTVVTLEADIRQALAGLESQ